MNIIKEVKAALVLRELKRLMPLVSYKTEPAVPPRRNPARAAKKAAKRAAKAA